MPHGITLLYSVKHLDALDGSRGANFLICPWLLVTVVVAMRLLFGGPGRLSHLDLRLIRISFRYLQWWYANCRQMVFIQVKIVVNFLVSPLLIRAGDNWFVA